MRNPEDVLRGLFAALDVFANRPLGDEQRKKAIHLALGQARGIIDTLAFFGRDVEEFDTQLKRFCDTFDIR